MLLCGHNDGRSTGTSEAARGLRFLLIAALGGCGMASDGSPDANPLNDAPERGLREVFRLGGPDAPEEAAFQREPAFAVDVSGSAYVLHRDLGRIAVFDASGGFLRWIGRGRGEGPGEFTFPMALGFVADTLWVRNFSPPSMTRFLTDGTHVDSDLLVVRPDYRTTAGVQGVSGYLQGGLAWMVPDGYVMGAGTDLRAPFILGDRRLERQDTFFTWRAGRGRLAGTAFDPIPEPPFHAVAPDGSGFVLVDWQEDRPDVLTVRILGPDGAERRSWTYSVPLNAVTTEERDRIVARAQQQVTEIRERLLAQGLSESMAPSVPSPAEVREQVFMPGYYPPVRSVRFGIDNTIWLHLSPGADAGPWVALDAGGTPLFRVVLPDGFRLRHASRQSVWGTGMGEYDVPYLLRWEILSEAGR